MAKVQCFSRKSPVEEYKLRLSEQLCRGVSKKPWMWEDPALQVSRDLPFSDACNNRYIYLSTHTHFISIKMYIIYRLHSVLLVLTLSLISISLLLL